LRTGKTNYIKPAGKHTVNSRTCTPGYVGNSKIFTMLGMRYYLALMENLNIEK
jgi:hypothetical protein